nr:unnamed protein product [Callosobruchus chinensis]
MIVAELPNDNPILRTEPTSKVEIGQKVKAECYSPGSDPPANISWYINDDRILTSDLNIRLWPLQIESDPAIGLKSSKSKLEIEAIRSFFTSGFMRIRCEASIFSLWQRHVDVTIKEDNQLQLAPSWGLLRVTQIKL